jgi:hypothetical protein
MEPNRYWPYSHGVRLAQADLDRRWLRGTAATIRGQFAASPTGGAGNRQTQRRRERIQGAAQALDRGTHVRLVRPQSSVGPGLRGANRHSEALIHISMTKRMLAKIAS